MKLTRGFEHDKREVVALGERTLGDRFRDKLGTHFACDMPTGEVRDGFLRVQDGLGRGEESGQKTAGKVSELHDDGEGSC